MIILKRTKNNKFYFIVRAKNGLTLAHSEEYQTYKGMVKGAFALFNSCRPITMQVPFQKWTKADISQYFEDQTGIKRRKQ